MIPMWLYSADGRPLHYAYATMPAAPVVTFNGQYFYWNGRTSRYELPDAPIPCLQEAPRLAMGAEPTDWVEVWGVEKNCLMKFPSNQWNDTTAQESLSMLFSTGVLGVEVRRVDK